MLPERNILLSTSDEELTAFCKISFVKGTGPGGQKRNKTSSAVQIELSELAQNFNVDSKRYGIGKVEIDEEE